VLRREQSPGNDPLALEPTPFDEGRSEQIQPFVSTTGAAADTVNSSDIAPTSNFMSTGALKPVTSTMLLRTTFLNPVNSNVTENVPIGTTGNW